MDMSAFKICLYRHIINIDISFFTYIITNIENICNKRNCLTANGMLILNTSNMTIHHIQLHKRPVTGQLSSIIILVRRLINCHMNVFCLYNVQVCKTGWLLQSQVCMLIQDKSVSVFFYSKFPLFIAWKCIKIQLMKSLFFFRKQPCKEKHIQ